MQSEKINSRFQQVLATFPPPAREHIENIRKSGGMLSGENCLAVREILNISTEDLMLRLLPLAKLYCCTAISDFQVGAAAYAKMSGNARDDSLFLGANIEFPTQALTQTIHAEQSATINAWLQGAKQIETIAVTAEPCGHCRQFLYELEDSRKLDIILQKPDMAELTKYKLSDLLPLPFGPHELGLESGFMTLSTQSMNVNLQLPSDDSFVLQTLEAARQSYSPYSHNPAGCGLLASSGKMYIGRCAENAAFNPSLSALQTALICMNMDQPGLKTRISRAVLVEKPTAISQRAACELLLRTVAPDVNLEYFEAV